MGKEWRRIRRICQYYHSQEWPDTHNPQSAKKKISSFFHDSLALLFVSYWQMGKALPFFKNFATGGHSYVFDHHIFVSLCHFFSSSSLLLPLSVNVFILSRWLYWHYHNESQPRGEPRLLKIIVAPKKTFCNRMLWKIPKMNNFAHQIKKNLDFWMVRTSILSILYFQLQKAV